MTQIAHKRQWRIAIDCMPLRLSENDSENLARPIFIVAITEKDRFLDVRTFTSIEDLVPVCNQALKSAIHKVGAPDRLTYDPLTAILSRGMRHCAMRFNIFRVPESLCHATMLERLLTTSNVCGQNFSNLKQVDQLLKKWAEKHNAKSPLTKQEKPERK